MTLRDLAREAREIGEPSLIEGTALLIGIAIVATLTLAALPFGVWSRLVEII